ncbi:Gly-Xaa carboxypeptidase [Sporothrix curviconia]|uniref:Gly-Xaa carboxypeptidase n=1 Tax=Sporothrix curviconia TaxID=1260050 RepID=A0ABP0B9D5_9PEZI
MVDAKQPHAVLPTGHVAARAPLSWRRRAALLVAVIATVLLSVRGYHTVMSVRGAALLRPVSAHHYEPRPPPPPRCPAQQAIVPSARPDITDRNVHQLFKSPAFRNLSVSRLAGAVQIQTVDFEDMGRLGEDPRWDVFYDLQRYFAETFPLLHKTLQLDVVNEHNLVYTWHGGNSALKPVLLMSHLDTVPVADDTLVEWKFPPFSGHFDGKYIWGRGSHDCKNNVVAILAAVTALVEQGFVPQRTVILAFGYDEESPKYRYGAAKIADHLRQTWKGENGRESDNDSDTFAIILDEGGIGINRQYGRTFATPQANEKGYLDAVIDVHVRGGHSSIPSAHSSIGLLALVVSRLEAEAPALFPLQLATDSPYYTLLQCAAEDNATVDMSSALRAALLNVGRGRSHEKEDLDRVVALLADDPAAASLLHTTQAVTIFHAGNKANALPAFASALVNYRVSSQETLAAVHDKLVATVAPVAEKLGLSFSYGMQRDGEEELPENALRLSWRPSQREPSPVSTTDSPSWAYFSGVIKHVFDEPGVGKDVLVAPAYAGGNTDTVYFWDLSSQIYRFGPLRAWHDEEQSWGGVHDVNERIALDAHLEAVRNDFVRDAPLEDFFVKAIAERYARSESRSSRATSKASSQAPSATPSEVPSRSSSQADMALVEDTDTARRRFRSAVLRSEARSRSRSASRASRTSTGSEASGTPGMPEALPPNSMVVAQVLCQAYHYMLTAGLEFGYVASGDALVFLRVLEDDPLTLHYFLPPMPSPDPVFVTGPARAYDTSAAHLCSLILLALKASTRARSGGGVDYTTGNVAGPAGGAAGGAAGGTSGAATSGTTSVGTALALPYCTQACLLGLRNGLPMDPKCPNVALHRSARILADSNADAASGNVDADNDHHPLTPKALRQRLRQQLAKDMDRDCECLDKLGCFGSTGVLFRLTITGYGYTLVGKAVQAAHREKLLNEADIYDEFRSVQGVLIPVELGIVTLAIPLPLHTCARVPYMMLLSYAGPTLDDMRKLLPEGIDWQAETSRTQHELQRMGMWNTDIRPANLAWNAET